MPFWWTGFCFGICEDIIMVRHAKHWIVPIFKLLVKEAIFFSLFDMSFMKPNLRFKSLMGYKESG